MNKFTYNDIVKTVDHTPAELRPGQQAWVVGISEDRRGKFLEMFPTGVVYTIEFEDGSSIEVHESNLVFFDEAI